MHTKVWYISLAHASHTVMIKFIKIKPNQSHRVSSTCININFACRLSKKVFLAQSYLLHKLSSRLLTKINEYLNCINNLLYLRNQRVQWNKFKIIIMEKVISLPRSSLHLSRLYNIIYWLKRSYSKCRRSCPNVFVDLNIRSKNWKIIHQTASRYRFSFIPLRMKVIASNTYNQFYLLR